MAGVLLLFLIFAGSPSIYAAQSPQKSFVGCFNSTAAGTLQFGAVPSGNLFALRGNTKLAEEHVNQLIRLSGEVDRQSGDKGSPAILTVVRVQALAKSCTSVLPAKTLDGVPGKVGEDGVDVPLTDTLTEDRTTPGFQTEAAEQHPMGTHMSMSSLEPVTAPPHPEQVGQSEAAADVSASSVERTEILPENTLGVNGSYNPTEERGNAR